MNGLEREVNILNEYLITCRWYKERMYTQIIFSDLIQIN